MEPVRVGLLGCGTVGGSLAAQLTADAQRISRQCGLAFEVTRVGVRSLSAERLVRFPDGVLTRDAAGVVQDPDVDVVVETIGGVEPARHLVLAALRAGKPVVTANKELVANVGDELFDAADEAGVDLAFEAAVGGGIPLLGVLRRALAGERIDRVMGIVNGTTNYILTKMTQDGADFGEVLVQAQRLGYAEADPTADVEGLDAGAKAAILAMTAFGARVYAGDVYCEGISSITAADIEAAARMGHVVKLLAVAERIGAEIAVRVHPAMVPQDHPLASVSDAFNAVFLEGAAVGGLMLYGQGAGGPPTASALLGDLIAVARNLRRGVHERLGPLQSACLRPIDETCNAFHLQFEVDDTPGVLARVAGVFGQHNVSIRSVEQTAQRRIASDDVPVAHLELITHRAREADVTATLRDLRRLPPVRAVGPFIRVVG